MEEKDASRLLIFIGVKSGKVASKLDSSRTDERREPELVVEEAGEGG